MKLYVMRHGEAEPPQAGRGLPGADALRPLTGRGRRETEVATEWLKSKSATFDMAIVSPYVRTQETFAIVREHIPVEVTEISEQVTPEQDAEAFASELMARLQLEPAQTVLIVSHMPFVCYLISYLDRCMQPPLFPTSGIAVVEAEPLAMCGKVIEFYREAGDCLTD
ncbi:MAG: phosphohistidine phosphatase SixA [Idiomarina sp.]|nr:phosphohistidine phosphatase SixA [Idiomarina sp.]